MRSMAPSGSRARPTAADRWMVLAGTRLPLSRALDQGGPMSELTAEEIVDLCLRHTLYDWQQQGTTRPIPVASAKGCEFFTVDGKRYLDFNSQLMGVNI